jgi:hypothetical protein
MLRAVSSTSDAASAEPVVEPATGEPVEAVVEPESIRPTPAVGQAVAPRPPVLASEALRRDLVPSAPAAVLARRLAVVVGTLGASQALAWSGGTGIAVPLAGAFAAIVALGLAPMSYAARAASIATVAGSALGVAAFVETAATGRFEPLVLATGITVLSAALLFRAWHRASWLARALAALGIAVCAGFLAMSEALRQLPIVDPSWQAWLPQVLQLFLVLLLFLSLLAFMDARSTGGCDAWAFCLLGWYVIFRAVETLAWRFPAARVTFDAATAKLAKDAAENAALHSALPLLTGMLAISLAQLWAARAAARAS